MVVNLAVDDSDAVSILGTQRLRSAGRVDDRQSSMDQDSRTAPRKAVPVRPAMVQGPYDSLLSTPGETAQRVDHRGDAAHLVQPMWQCRTCPPTGGKPDPPRQRSPSPSRSAP